MPTRSNRRVTRTPDREQQAPVPAKHDGNTPTRDARGRFLPGYTANPNGRPPAEFSARALLRMQASQRPKALSRIFDLCESEDEHVAVKAILGLAQFLDGNKGAEVNVNIDQRQIVLTWEPDGR